jgi:hypothetical protein
MCAFCGGQTTATTREHCPPQAMFLKRQAPDDLEFPACDACNHPTSDDDLLIAWLGRIDPESDSGNADFRLPGLMRAMHAQFPKLGPAMCLSAREARRRNAATGTKPAPGQTHQQAAGVLKVTPEVTQAVCTVGRKLAKGLYYRETGDFFPEDGCILMYWCIPERTIAGLDFPALHAVQGMSGARTPTVCRNRQSLADQFTYHLAYESAQKKLMVAARFRSAFGMVLFACAIRGKLEEFVQSQDSNEAFFVLHSPIL